MFVLGARYHHLALLGATIIIFGASLTVTPCLLGTCDNGSDISVKWYSILIYFASNIPMAMSAVYKEIAFKDARDQVYFCPICCHLFYLG